MRAISFRLTEEEINFLNRYKNVSFGRKTATEVIRTLIDEEVGLKPISKTCFFCGSKKYIHEHHLDGNKKNNHKTNLVFLCMSCHSKIRSLHLERLRKPSI